MADIEICFTEQASDMAGAADALSSLAMIEGTLRMVRERFDRRGPE